MKISIIMPIYNGENSLEKSLDSILNQSYKNIELILVDDGSIDGSLDICRNYKNKDNRIVLRHIENSGPGRARNLGLDLAQGEYISFVDADDFLKEDFLERVIPVAERDNYHIVSTNHFIVDKDISISKNNYSTGKIDKKGTGEERERYNQFKTSSSFGYVWGKLYKSSLLRENKIRFSEERKVFLEDTLFNLKAITYNPSYYVLNEAFYYYNIYQDSLSNKKEDITPRVIKVLEDYEEFLVEKDEYRENLDLFIPLGTRVIAWSLAKTMEDNYKLKNIYSKILIFSKNESLIRLFQNKNAFRELKKLSSPLQRLLYSFIILSFRLKRERLLALFFYVNYPVFKIYIRNSVKN